jgi:hypothetical protein
MAKILFLAANPEDSKALRLDNEIREIDAALRGADPSREDFAIIQWWDVRPTELSTFLLRHRPDVVHFCGHGEEDGIIVTDAERRSTWVSGEYLKRVLGILNDSVRCVVLNACYSETLANPIAEVVDVVVGMRGPVEDDVAIAFSASFYKALGHGRDVGTAFDLACAEIQWAKNPPKGPPQNREATVTEAGDGATAAGEPTILWQASRSSRGSLGVGATAAWGPIIRYRETVKPGDVKIVTGRRGGAPMTSPDAAQPPISRAQEALETQGRRSTLPDSARAEAYLELVRRLKPLARYDRAGALITEKLREVSVAMRDWYFDEGGWLYLTDACRIPYFDLKDALEKAITSGAGEATEPEVRVKAENLVALVLRHGSALRKALRESFDVGMK